MDAHRGTRKKLSTGVYLIYAFQEVAGRDCEHCQLYVYDEKTGAVERQFRVGGPGPPIKRAKGTPPPCRTARGCAKGTPEHPLDLTPQNHRAYFHFQQCETTGRWPDDSRVLRNAAIIASARTRAKEQRQWTDSKLTQLKLDAMAAALGQSIQLRALG